MAETITRPEFVELMTRLRTCYPQPMSDPEAWMALVATYYSVVSRYDAPSVRRAMASAWARHREWFPTLGQLVAIVEGDSPPSLRAAEAWPEVLRLAAGAGGAHSDPTAAEAMALMGGADGLGQWDARELERYGRARFVATYVELVERRRLGPGRPALPDADPRLARLAGEVADRRAMQR